MKQNSAAIATAVLALGTLMAQAQSPSIIARVEPQLRMTAPRGVVMGPTIKNAAYSGEEVSLTQQLLGDGTRIHKETRTKIFRDNEGRVRRETGDQITITDPVAGVAYMLDSKNMTARKMTYNVVTTTNADGTVVFRASTSGGGGSASSSGSWTTSSGGVVAVGGGARGGSGSAAAAGGGGGFGGGRGGALPTQASAASAEEIATAKAQLVRIAEGSNVMEERMKIEARAAGNRETLSPQMIEGLLCQGTRSTSTIEVGAIGNDRALVTSSERWYSPELKAVVMTKHVDPRTGEESFRLTNVSRNNPDLSLFQLSGSYRLEEEKSPERIRIEEKRFDN